VIIPCNLALWLLIIPSFSDRPVSYVPFATEKACEEAREKMMKHSRMLESGTYSARQAGPSHEKMDGDAMVRPRL
jgi:hypothetical protein